MKTQDRASIHGPTAVTVMRNGDAYELCPFFGKCDGLLIVAPVGTPVEFIANPTRDAKELTDLVVGSEAARLICGFVPESERTRLCAAGVDIRLGSCACTVDELIVEFASLPQA